MKWFSALVWKWSRLFQTLSQRSYQIEKIIFREAPGSTKQITLHVKNAVEFMNQGSANTSQIQPICQLISHISRNLLHENQTIKLGCPKSVHLHFRESDLTILTTINKWFSKKKKPMTCLHCTTQMLCSKHEISNQQNSITLFLPAIATNIYACIVNLCTCTWTFMFTTWSLNQRKGKML